jgi:hypothetical protein
VNRSTLFSVLTFGAALVALPAPAPAAEAGIAGQAAATAADAADPEVPGARRATAPEAALADLARAALRKPESVETWTSISRVLREFRPEAFRDLPSGAERAALEVVESVAARVPGAIREIRVQPSGPHTEIVVHTNGEIRHRLFRRLSDTPDPRLILVLHGASVALTETDFERIDRGGVRAIRIGEPAPDTVHVTIHLAEATGFMLLRREGQIVVRIENPAGAFVPWSSRPAWAAPTATAPRAGTTPGITGRVDRGEDPIGPAATDSHDGVDSIGSALTDGVAGVEGAVAAAAAEGTAVAARSESAAPLTGEASGAVSASDATAAFELAARATAALASALDASRAMVGATGRALRDAMGRFRTPAPARAAETAIAVAILGVALFGFFRHRRGGPSIASAMKVRLRRRATAGRSPAGARVWAAQTLVASGAPTVEVARRTGLPQDALVLLRTAHGGVAEAALPAASGSFFRPATSYIESRRR